MTCATFQPTDSQRAEALDLLSSGSLSLAEIATRLSASLESLAAWAAQPATQALLASVETLAHLRARLVAAAALPTLAEALSRMVTAGDAALTDAAPPEQARRSRETIRRAGALLTRLARTTPPSADASKPPPHRGQRTANSDAPHSPAHSRPQEDIRSLAIQLASPAPDAPITPAEAASLARIGRSFANVTPEMYSEFFASCATAGREGRPPPSITEFLRLNAGTAPSQTPTDPFSPACTPGPSHPHHSGLPPDAS